MPENEKQQFFKKIARIALLILVTGLQLQADPHINLGKIKHESDSLLNQLTQIRDDNLKMALFYRIGHLQEEIYPNQALFYYHKGLALCEENKDYLNKVRFLNEIGSSHQLLQHFEKAIYYRVLALIIADRYHYETQKADILNNLGSTYVEIRQYNLAKSCFEKTLAIRLRNNQTGKIALLYSNLGALCGLTHKLDQCIKYCRKAIEYSKQYSPQMSLNLPYINLGDAYMEMDSIYQAESCYLKALQEVATMEDLIDCYLDLGTLYLKKKQYSKAGNYLKQAEANTLKHSIKRILPEVYEKMTDYYATIGNYKNAYVYSGKLKKINDEIFNERKTRQMNEILSKYEAANKDKQIIRLNQEKLLEAEKTDKELLHRNLIIAGIVVLLLLGTLYARIVLLKQKIKNKILQEGRKEIENQYELVKRENTEARFEVLKSKVNPHFLFNSLSSLASIISEGDSKLAISFINHFTYIFRAALETGSQSTIPMEKELEIVNGYVFIQKQRFGDRFSIHLPPKEDFQNLYIAPFVLQMLIENAMNHNQITKLNPLAIQVKLTENFLEVKNNLNPKSKPAKSTGIGQSNIISRYSILTAVKPEFSQTKNEYISRIPLLTLKQL